MIKRHASKAAFAAQVRRALDRGAQPVLLEAKAAALSLPSQGTASGVHGRRHLRKKIANSLVIERRLGSIDPSVSIVSRRDRMPVDQQYLPARTNEGKWRHPVYGNSNAWVAQSSRQGWFDQTVAKSADNEVRDSLLDVLSFLQGKWIIK